MPTRLALPFLQNRVKSEAVEQRFDLGMGGFSFPMVNATGSQLITDRALESYSGSEIAYRCVQIIVPAMAALDLAIERETIDEAGAEGVDLDKDSSLPQLFNKRPNPAVSSVELKRIAFEQMELSGKTFLYLQRKTTDPESPVAGIGNIYGKVTPVTYSSPDSRDDLLIPQVAGYQVQTSRGVIGLLPHEVLWLRYPHPTIPGESVAPWKAAMWAADLDQKARQWQAAEFANGGKPTGVIYLGDVTDDQARRVKAQFESQQAGTANAGKHLFLYGQTKAEYSRIARTGIEMGYLETHKQNGVDLMHAMGVPIDLVVGQATYDNRHSAWVSLWTDTLTPKLELIEAAIDRQLLPDVEDRAVFDKSKVAALQENTDAIYTRATQAWQADGMTLAEYRKELGKEPLGTPADQMIYSQLQAEYKPAPVTFAPPGQEASQDQEPEDGADKADEAPADEGRVTEADLLELRATGADLQGVMVGLWVTGDAAEQLAQPGHEPVEQLHLTLAFIGSVEDDIDVDLLKLVVEHFASTHGPVSAVVGGKGQFKTPDGAAVIALADSPGLDAFRVDLAQALSDAGLPVADNHGWIPHITIAYVPDADRAADVAVPMGVQLSWNAVTLAWGTEHFTYPLLSERLGPPPVETRKQVGIPMETYHRAIDKHQARIKRAMERLGEKQRRVVLRKLTKVNERIAKGHEIRVSHADVFDEAYWEDQTNEALADPIDSAWTEGAIETALLLGIAWKLIETDIAAKAKEHTEAVAKQITETTAKAVDLAISGSGDDPAGVTARVREVFDALIPGGEEPTGWRSSMIGETEAATGYARGGILTAIGAGSDVTTITWVAHPGCCPLCDELDGTTIGIDESFPDGAVMPLHPRCICIPAWGTVDDTEGEA